MIKGVKLRIGQVRGAKFAWVKRKAALFMEPRTGKTLTALQVLVWAFQRERLRRVLIICPKKVKTQWVAQINQYLALEYNIYDKNELLEKPRNGKLLTLLSGTTVNILIVNYESLNRYRKALLLFSPQLIIIDESHKLKNYKSQQSKAAAKITPGAKRCLILTGTPKANEDIDFYGQYRAMDFNIFGVAKKFLNKYTRRAGYQLRKKKIKNHMRDEYFKKIKDRCFYLTRKEAFPVPQEQEIIYEFEFSPKVQKHYDELENGFYTQYKDMESSSKIMVSNMIKLQQLCGGFLPLDDDTLVELDQDKLGLLLEIIDNYPIDEKIVIFVKFTHEIDIIEKGIKKLKRSYAILDGRTKDDTSWQKFQKYKDPAIYIAQISAGGVGIDLYKSDVAIFYSKSFSYIDYKQARDRLISPGCERTISYIHLLAKNSIDIDQHKVLNKKDQGALAILKFLRRRKMTKEKAKVATKATAKPDAKKAAPAKAEAKTEKKAAAEGYGVAYIAEALGIEPFTVRQKMRKAKIEKNGKSYSWPTKKEADEVAKQLKSVKLKGEA